jgi:ATPase subunit of ABC transporter with duplicated ATPase domains
MLAGVLTQTADIMILDEPTNFLDLLGVIWLETYLKQLREDSTKTVVLVSHDRAFLDAICEEIVILKDQTLEYFRGNVSAYEADLKSKRLYWGRMKEAQDHQKSHMEATIRENIKLGKKTGDDNKLAMAKSRQKKMDERMGVQVNANGGRFKLNRDHAGWHDSLRAEIEVPPEERGVSMVIPDAPELRFPGSLISAESLSFRYCPKDAPVLDSVDLVIHMGDRVGLMGLNGCGKTTLLRLLTGSLDSPQGKVARHSRLKLGYYSQHSVEDLHKMGQSEAGLTALTLIRRDTEGALDEGEARGLLGSLGLPGRTASDVPVAQLSGGQLVSNGSPFIKPYFSDAIVSVVLSFSCRVQVRLALARILWKTPHLLILDEVTTHLDFHTVRGLAVALSSFNGAILLVSHDRYLVRSVVEGKKDADPAAAESADAELEIAEEEPEDSARRRSVYVLRSGKLHLQATGVADFEASLEKRVRKMMREA